MNEIEKGDIVAIKNLGLVYTTANAYALELGANNYRRGEMPSEVDEYLVLEIGSINSGLMVKLALIEDKENNQFLIDLKGLILIRKDGKKMSLDINKKYENISIKERKITYNIGTIGQIAHGKTTLTEAIRCCLGKSGYKVTNKTMIKDLVRHNPTVETNYIQYETKENIYNHIDCPGHREYLKNMFSGAVKLDGAIVVVSVLEGVMMQTREHLQILRKLGADNIMVFINKVDKMLDREIIAYVETEIEKTLKSLGFKRYYITFGSAREVLEAQCNKKNPYVQQMYQFLKEMDKMFCFTKESLHLKPFLGYIDKIRKTQDKRIATVYIKEGILKLGENIKLYSNEYGHQNATILSLEQSREKIKEASCGSIVGVTFSIPNKYIIKNVILLDNKQEISMKKDFQCQFRLFSEKENKRLKPIVEKRKVLFGFFNSMLEGEIIVKNDTNIIFPGELSDIEIKLQKETFLLSKEKFVIFEGREMIGEGLTL